MGVLGAFSCCTGDAFASALGSRLANEGDVFLITTFEKVPKVVFFLESGDFPKRSLSPSSQGTNGGVSFIGLATSLIGGLVIGVAYFMGIFMSVSQVLMIIMRVVSILFQQSVFNVYFLRWPPASFLSSWLEVLVACLAPSWTP